MGYKAGFHTGFLSGGVGGKSLGRRGCTRLFDHNHFSETTPI